MPAPTAKDVIASRHSPSFKKASAPHLISDALTAANNIYRYIECLEYLTLFCSALYPNGQFPAPFKDSLPNDLVTLAQKLCRDAADESDHLPEIIAHLTPETLWPYFLIPALYTSIGAQEGIELTPDGFLDLDDLKYITNIDNPNFSAKELHTQIYSGLYFSMILQPFIATVIEAIRTKLLLPADILNADMFIDVYGAAKSGDRIEEHPKEWFAEHYDLLESRNMWKHDEVNETSNFSPAYDYLH